ncbi:MAG: aldehyde ferredoxin oxidoreductase family protein [Candidatus Heimdallarchaeota archaeon]|nr:MAG: aldehyde ferredoxin oxidoreductase family protein [Candidatus Heimdallarchaeota archaeon]
MGYMGKYLDVNLSTGKITEVTLDMCLAEMFIGGKGLGAKILYDTLNSGVDPLSSDNILLFMTGPLSGTSVQTSGRWCIVTKSPHTGIFLDSQIGGKFGHRLKRAGFDFILFRGKADMPSYLEVSSETVEIHPANDLWGKGTYEVEEILKKKHIGSEVCTIGPAGENLVTFASVMTDRTHMAGRGGAGAVMGSKNLKAVVVRGSRNIEAVDPKKFKELTRAFAKKVRENPGVKRRHEIGTVMWVKMANEAGFLPTKNFQSGVFNGADEISGERMRDEFVVGHTACYRCLIACGKTTRFTEGKYAGLEVDGPEYETSALLGASCEINDLGAIAKSNLICDDLGMDTITVGGTIAFAMECSKKGILDQKDVRNFEFGNAEAQHEMLHLIANRKGIGELFAKGSFAAAKEIDCDSSDFAVQVKKLELAGVEPRGSFGMALAYATADRGGCHQRCWTPSAELSGSLTRFSFDGVPKFVKEAQDERAACFSLVLCDFLPFDVVEMVEMLNTATGFSYTPESYLLTGERIWNVTRLINTREGITALNDVLPVRFYQEEAPSGDPKGQNIDLEKFEETKLEYYRLRGWDRKGIPTKEKLKTLAL